MPGVASDRRHNPIPGFTLLYFSALAGDAAWGPYGKSADLAYVQRGLDEATDVVATLSYGDPFPDEWTRFVTAVNWYRTEFTIGASVPTDVWATTSAARTRGTGEQLVAPEIDPPSNVVVDGTPAVNGAAVSLEPLIEWTAPALGSADYYLVRVVALDENPGARAGVTTVARILTSEPSVRLPPGVIEARGLSNHGYVLVIRAVSAPDMDPAKPLVIPWPSSGADTMVGVLMPPVG